MIECTKLLVTDSSEVAVIKSKRGYALSSIDLDNEENSATLTLDELQEVCLALGELLEREL